MKTREQIIAENITFARNKLKLNLRQLGEMVGKTEATVSRWESGIHAPSKPLIPKLCEVLQVSEAWLVSEHNFVPLEAAPGKQDPAAEPMITIPVSTYNKLLMDLGSANNENVSLKEQIRQLLSRKP